MAFHTYPVDQADALEDESRFAICSREELVAAIDPAPDAVVADLGSGTGFYTDEVAPFVETLYGVDVQPEMHDHYREKGVPDGVELTTAAVADLPFATAELDAAFSTMTYHEYATDDALTEIRRVLASGGRHVVVDWSATGHGERGPPVDERFALETARNTHEDAGFSVVAGRERPETFVLVATAP